MKLKGMLLRHRPYTISANDGKNSNLRVVLSPLSGLKVGTKVYQVLKDDGVIELIPEKIFVERGYADNL